MAANLDMVAALRSYLDRDDWKYKYDSERNIIECGLNLRGKVSNIRMLIAFNKFGFTTYGICPLNVGEEYRMEVMKYLSRANYDLKNGNFEMDVRDGEVRYKVYTNLDGMSTVSDGVLSNCMRLPGAMFQRYGNGLATLMMGFSTAEDEIVKAEADM